MRPTTGVRFLAMMAIQTGEVFLLTGDLAERDSMFHHRQHPDMVRAIKKKLRTSILRGHGFHGGLWGVVARNDGNAKSRYPSMAAVV